MTNGSNKWPDDEAMRLTYFGLVSAGISQDPTPGTKDLKTDFSKTVLKLMNLVLQMSLICRQSQEGESELDEIPRSPISRDEWAVSMRDMNLAKS